MKKLFLTLCFVGASAHADFRSGNELLEDMRSNSYPSQAFAMGYISGVFDATRGFVHCAPGTATVGQVNDMVQNYLQTSPGERNNPGTVLVMRVLQKQWPCKKGNTL